MNNGKTRSSLIGIVGAYLLYIAYELFQGRAETDTTMTPAARIFFIALFVLAGIGLLVYAVFMWRRSAKDEEEQKRKQDENALK